MDRLDAWLTSVETSGPRPSWQERRPWRAVEGADPLFSARGRRAGELIRALLPHLADAARRWSESPGGSEGHGTLLRARAAFDLYVTLLAAKPTLDWSDLAGLLRWHTHDAPTDWHSPAALRDEVARRVAQDLPDADLREALAEHADAVRPRLRPDQRTQLRETLWLAAPCPLAPGEDWADELRAELSELPATDCRAWSVVLRSSLGVRGARPGKRWTATAPERVDALDLASPLRAALRRFIDDLPDDDAPPAVRDWNERALRGLLWHLPHAATPPDPELLRLLGEAAVAGYRAPRGGRPRAQKLANTAVLVLGACPGERPLHALALLRLQVRDRRLLRRIDQVLDDVLERVGLSRDELDEVAVPTFGLGSVGRRVVQLGDATATVTIPTDGGRPTLTWTKIDSRGRVKTVKSAPASVRRDHGSTLRALRADVKSLGKVLSAHRERLDALFLADPSWEYAVWRERYLDHPVLGTLARRLIWELRGTGSPLAAIWTEDGDAGCLADVEGRPLTSLGDGVRVRLWHPIGAERDEVLAWRERLFDLRVTQPFKQAHREVYRLTDAERATEVYSNRFAAHVLKQHQFHALARLRRWDDKLRLMVDDVVPPTTRRLPSVGLRAEFWVEPVGDTPGEDTNESGTYLRVATDQVRFYRLDAAQRVAHAYGGGFLESTDDDPLPLTEVPALVFSEIMRDVDLFVGVASIGNDPEWEDGRLDGELDAYWRDYSFGRLNATARTRRETLSGLLPRLAIGDRCSLDDRFLVVRGDLRTYRIHLGSGNVLMEPDNEYLCIVPDSRTSRRGGAGTGKLYLPFEGDRTLSIVLSKALLLARDTTITDRTILNQIGARVR